MSMLVISDVHLGSPMFKKKELLKELLRGDFDQVIINGDFYELLGFKNRQQIDDENRDLLEILQKHDIVWIGGNHDDREIETLEYSLNIGNKKIMITHGHKFEGASNAWITKLNIILYQILGIDFRVLFKWVKNDYYRNNSIKLSEHYSEYDWVIIGHYHNLNKTGNIINCGDWIEHASYVVIEGEEIKLFNLST